MAATANKDEVIPADITQSTFIGGMYHKYGECRFCKQTRMMAFNTDDVDQDEVDKAATMACDCQEAREFQHIQMAADKAKGNLRTLNEQMNANFQESVLQHCENAIDIIAAGLADKVSFKSGSREIVIRPKKDKINVSIKKTTKADIDA